MTIFYFLFSLWKYPRVVINNPVMVWKLVFMVPLLTDDQRVEYDRMIADIKQELKRIEEAP